MPAGWKWARGRPTNRSKASRFAAADYRVRPSPELWALAAGRAEVGIDLAGDVTLQAADDLRLGFPLGRAAFGVGAGGRVRAQPGEHDPPQGTCSLAVTAGVSQWRVTLSDEVGIGAALGGSRPTKESPR